MCALRLSCCVALICTWAKIRKYIVNEWECLPWFWLLVSLTVRCNLSPIIRALFIATENNELMQELLLCAPILSVSLSFSVFNSRMDVIIY